MRKNLLIKLIGLLALSFTATRAFATASLGEVAENILGPTAYLTQFIVFGCYILGVGLILGSVVQYRNHRQNPKLVPLTTPVLLLLLGIVLLVLPYISTHSGESWSASEEAKKKGSTEEEQPGRIKFHEMPKPGQTTAPQPQQPTQPARPAVTPPPSGGGHWSSDPRYQNLK